MTKKNRLLLIFIKNPIPGKVKTRLGKSIGHDAAVEVYKKLLKRTREAAIAANCDCHLYYGDYINQQDDWSPKYFEKFLQHSGDLGARMNQAFAQSFERGYSKVLIIGSDCPEMSEAVIHKGFDTLDEADTVLGPATDGGYYLLGMRSYYNLFEDIAWSTEHVFESTVKKIEANGRSFGKMTEMSDLDTIEDLQHYPDLA